jgi:hypothetical protein
MVAPSTMNRRLFKLCVATIVAIAMVVTMSIPSTAYADTDNRRDPGLFVQMLTHDEDEKDGTLHR